MGHPGPVVARPRLPFLVLAHLGERPGVDLGVGAAGDERRHAPHGVGTSPVAGGDEQVGVGLHEGHGHRHLVAVGEHPGRVVAELLDHREDVVPSPGVEPGGVVPQLVEDLVHLQGGQDGLDEHGGPDGAVGDSPRLLGGDEDVVPQSRLEVGLQLGQVEVGAAAPGDEGGGVVEEEQPEVEQGRRYRVAVDEHVGVDQVPAAGSDHQRRRVLTERVVAPVRRGQLDGAPDGVDQVDLALDQVPPGGGARVLEVGHEHPGAGVEGVDHHLPVDRPGDLAAAVGQVGRSRRPPSTRPPECRRSPRASPGSPRRRCGAGAPSSPPAVAGGWARTGDGARR